MSWPSGRRNTELLCVLGVQSLPAIELHRLGPNDAAYNLASVVTFTLTPTSTGTHLRMEQSGFRPDQKQAYGGAIAGWQQFFANLELVLARLD